MGHVVVKYKVRIDQPDEGTPNYEEIAANISNMDDFKKFIS